MKVQHIKMLKDLVADKISNSGVGFSKRAVTDTENSKPTLDLDQETQKETFEQSVAEFLGRKE
jgi:hypothetical protein